MANGKRLAWTEVDLRAIEANTRHFRQIMGPVVQIIGVVKADAYGHGAAKAGQAMLRGGATRLMVATVGEARELRGAGLAAPIFVLGPTGADEAREALSLDLTLAITDYQTLRVVVAAAQATKTLARVHWKIDTGMHRLGLLPNEALAMMASVSEAPLQWEGIFTHFACADEPWRPETAAQIARFEALLGALSAAGHHFPIVHAANSAGALAFPHARYDTVRPGIALYGVAPGKDIPLPTGIRPALSFHTHVVRIADLEADTPISYGGSYLTKKPRRIATIAAGYADGLRRSPAWREVIVGGVRAPIVGHICMDYAMVDITGIPGVTYGDEVVLLGAQGDAAISAEEVATWLGTSAYEVLTSLRGR